MDKATGIFHLILIIGKFNISSNFDNYLKLYKLFLNIFKQTLVMTTYLYMPFVFQSQKMFATVYELKGLNQTMWQCWSSLSPDLSLSSICGPILGVVSSMPSAIQGLISSIQQYCTECIAARFQHMLLILVISPFCLRFTVKYYCYGPHGLFFIFLCR